MPHVVLLSAGQGKRLSHLTENKPKCLVSVGGKTLLEWQLQAIEACHQETGNIDGVTIIVGFEAKSVEAIVNVKPISLPVNCIYNPFYTVADNISSCWSAQHLLKSDCVLINGDTLFDRRILAKLLNKNDNSITVTIDHKENYDSDDMKVLLEGERLSRIGKTLTGKIDGESIGMLRFQKEGGATFVKEMDDLLRDPASLRLWYLSVIDRLASKCDIGVMSIDKLPWQEVDYPHDLAAAADRLKEFDWNHKSNKPEMEISTASTGSQKK